MMNWARDAKPGDFGGSRRRCLNATPVMIRSRSRSWSRGARDRRPDAQRVALGAERMALVGGVGEACVPISSRRSPCGSCARCTMRRRGDPARGRRRRASREARDEGLLRGAPVRRRAAARRPRARGRRRLIAAVDPLRGPASRRRGDRTRRRRARPGFIDWQINGGGGVLFNAEPTVEGIAKIAAAHRRAGVTGFLPTVVTDAPRSAHGGACGGARSAWPRSRRARNPCRGAAHRPGRPGVHPPN